MRWALFIAAYLLSACSHSASQIFTLHDGVRVKVHNAEVKEVRRFGSGFDTSGGYVEWVTVAASMELPELKITSHQYGREATRRTAVAVCKSESNTSRPSIGIDLLRDFLGQAADTAKPAYLLVPLSTCPTTQEVAVDKPLFMVCQGEGAEARCVSERPYRGFFVHYVLSGDLVTRAEEIDKRVSVFLTAHVLVLEHQKQ